MKQAIKKTIITISCIGLMFINTSVYATTAKTISETTRVRKEASTDASIVALISTGEEVNIISEEGEWYKVEYSSYTGYVRKDMLSVEENDSNQNVDSNNTTNTTEATNVNETEGSNTIEESQDNTSNETENEQNETEISENSKEEGENSDNSENTENTNIMQVGYIGKITSNLEIKILPLINSSVIETLDANTEFTVTDVINKWIYIETENNSGWVLSGKLESSISSEASSENQEQAPENEQEENANNETDTNTENDTNSENKETVAETVTKYVKTETLNVREAPESNAKIIKQLGLNDQVTVLEQIDSKWSKITFNGTTGYVSSSYLSDTKNKVSSRSETKNRGETNTTTSTSKQQETAPEPNTSTPTESTAPASSNKGTDVVSYAKQYLGSKYVAGGMSPSTGFDCSGFTSYVFKSCGISLSRTSSAQASNGSPVSRGELQPGDLVIFNNSSNSAIGHVGIYIGGNSFIHAANSKKGVIISSLSDSYYSPRFVTGRRVIN